MGNSLYHLLVHFPVETRFLYYSFFYGIDSTYLCSSGKLQWQLREMWFYVRKIIKIYNFSWKWHEKLKFLWHFSTENYKKTGVLPLWTLPDNGRFHVMGIIYTLQATMMLISNLTGVSDLSDWNRNRQKRLSTVKVFRSYLIILIKFGQFG